VWSEGWGKVLCVQACLRAGLHESICLSIHPWKESSVEIVTEVHMLEKENKQFVTYILMEAS
jgi:hypothetical protein